MPNQVRELNMLIHGNHFDCLDNFHVDRNAFGRLYIKLRNHGGLVDGNMFLLKSKDVWEH
ncbi:hypothetical protein ACS0TY_010675 [Phlomoides rotata]